MKIIIKLKQQKCDVTKFGIPSSLLSYNVILCRHPPPPLTCDVIYGCPLRKIYVLFYNIISILNNNNNNSNNRSIIKFIILKPLVPKLYSNDYIKCNY